MKRKAKEGVGGGGASGIAARKGGGEVARIEKEKLRDQVKAKRDAKNAAAAKAEAKAKKARDKAAGKAGKK